MGLYPDEFWTTYKPEEWYEKGRQEALRIQADEDHPPFDSPEWEERLRRDAQERDFLYEQVKEGWRDGDPNAHYLDGFLSVWD